MEGISDTENSVDIDEIISGSNSSKIKTSYSEEADEFTDLEASVYAKGEAEIEEEVRQEYIDENPDYAMVYEEGQQLESDYEAAMDEAEQEFLKENPEPSYYEETSPSVFDFSACKETDEHKKWAAKKEEYMNEAEAEYAENNPDYAALKEAQDKNESETGILASIKDFFS